ncbi:hypothetical protein BZG36_04525 [Bifiguratus adelaidae]|uniref:Uncharacterized protein n=1 Tax=Bifiguratus adelaidae TaxID=1938954 RepID=A0A261XXY2_9FUNG|nr:hypothetical protein BZG36_04525 [Bifiguratus adelaidae]
MSGQQVLFEDWDEVARRQEAILLRTLRLSDALEALTLGLPLPYYHPGPLPVPPLLDDLRRERYEDGYDIEPQDHYRPRYREPVHDAYHRRPLTRPPPKNLYSDRLEDGWESGDDEGYHTFPPKPHRRRRRPEPVSPARNQGRAEIFDPFQPPRRETALDMPNGDLRSNDVKPVADDMRAPLPLRSALKKPPQPPLLQQPSLSYLAPLDGQDNGYPPVAARQPLQQPQSHTHSLQHHPRQPQLEPFPVHMQPQAGPNGQPLSDPSPEDMKLFAPLASIRNSLRRRRKSWKSNESINVETQAQEKERRFAPLIRRPSSFYKPPPSDQHHQLMQLAQIWCWHLSSNPNGEWVCFDYANQAVLTRHLDARNPSEPVEIRDSHFLKPNGGARRVSVLPAKGYAFWVEGEDQRHQITINLDVMLIDVNGNTAFKPRQRNAPL